LIRANPYPQLVYNAANDLRHLPHYKSAPSAGVVLRRLPDSHSTSSSAEAFATWCGLINTESRRTPRIGHQRHGDFFPHQFLQCRMAAVPVPATIHLAARRRPVTVSVGRGEFCHPGEGPRRFTNGVAPAAAISAPNSPTPCGRYFSLYGQPSRQRVNLWRAWRRHPRRCRGPTVLRQILGIARRRRHPFLQVLNVLAFPHPVVLGFAQ